MKRYHFKNPLVKICCISSIEEAALAINHGANALGLVSEMPSGPGVISEEQIAEIASYIPPGVTSVLLTSKMTAPEIIKQQQISHVNAIQLCERLENGDRGQLRSSLPGISLIQVIHVAGKASIDEALTVSTSVDALLLDTGSRSESLTELGGTGRTHDWSISAQIVHQVNIPVFLAGGLNPDNVSAAIKRVKPYAVDICSGVRKEGILDEQKLDEFIRNVRD